MMTQQENVRYQDVKELKQGIKSLINRLDAVHPNTENKTEIERLKGFILLIKSVEKYKDSVDLGDKKLNEEDL